MHVALLVLRIVIGALFAGHGAQKLFGWFGGYGLGGTGGFFESVGLGPGRSTAFIAGVAALAAGLLGAVVAVGLGRAYAHRHAGGPRPAGA